MAAVKPEVGKVIVIVAAELLVKMLALYPDEAVPALLETEIMYGVARMPEPDAVWSSQRSVISDGGTPVLVG